MDLRVAFKYITIVIISLGLIFGLIGFAGLQGLGSTIGIAEILFLAFLLPNPIVLILMLVSFKVGGTLRKVTLALAVLILLILLVQIILTLTGFVLGQVSLVLILSIPYVLFIINYLWNR